MREVTFLRPGGDMTIRMMDASTQAICEAAVVLKATHFVTIDGWSEVVGMPVWGVFEMRSAQKNTPVPGQWSIDDPVKVFDTEKSDAAVMYAMHLAGRS